MSFCQYCGERVPPWQLCKCHHLNRCAPVENVRARVKFTEEKEMDGEKHDQGKARWDLLPWGPVRQIVAVLTFGAKKYAPHNWQKVDNPRERYFAALHRHLVAWREGELLDPETKLPHLAHAACCVLFLMWFDDRKEKAKAFKAKLEAMQEGGK